MHNDGFLRDDVQLGVSSLPLTNTISPLEGVSSLLMHPKPRLSPQVLHLLSISLSTLVRG